jgi:hypothetical protein
MQKTKLNCGGASNVDNATTDKWPTVVHAEKHAPTVLHVLDRDHSAERERSVCRG